MIMNFVFYLFFESSIIHRRNNNKTSIKTYLHSIDSAMFIYPWETWNVLQSHRLYGKVANMNMNMNMNIYLNESFI